MLQSGCSGWVAGEPKAEGLGTRMCGGQVGGDSGLGPASIQGTAEKETDAISRKQVKCMGVVSAAKEGKEERTEHLLRAHAGSSAEIPAPSGGQFGSIQLSDGHRHVQGHQVL